MSQAITSLSVGSKIRVSENGTLKLYEIAGFNIHGTDTVTLVRVKTTGSMVFGDTSTYDGSAIDAYCNAFEQVYNAYHRAQLINSSIICANELSEATTLYRKCFLLSYTEVGFGANLGIQEGTALTLYSSNASRIKYNEAGSAAFWYLRSRVAADTVRQVNTTGASYTGTVGGSGIVPAHVISSSLLVTDTTTDGGYDIYYPDTSAVATVTYPLNEYVNTNNPITFEWQHYTATGTAQTKADLQYAVIGGEWQALATVNSDADTATIPADTFYSGQWRWRVRTYNADNVAGEWSSPASFVGVGSPVTPTITSVSQCSRPVVSWSASGQIAYRVQIGSFDTKEAQGTATSYKLPHYIPNGTYTVKVAIKNASLIWSVWAETTLVLNVTGPTTPELTASAITGGASIAFSEDVEYLYLLRDGIPIADVTGLTSYADYAALGTVSYTLRAVDEDDNYTDSAIAVATVSVPFATLAAVDDLSDQITLMLTRGEPKRISGSIGQVVSYQRYAGRTKPVAVFSGHEDESYQMSVAFLDSADKDDLLMLIRRRKTMLYRDAWGNRWYVIVSQTGYDQDHVATSLALSMTVVDHIEEIDYAGVT